MIKRFLMAGLFLIALVGSSFSAATTTTLTTAPTGTGSDIWARSHTTVLTKTINFATYAAANTTMTVGSVEQIFTIPANSMVLGFYAKVTTAEGATCTLKVGDYADDDGYATALNLNSATSTFSFNATTTPAFGVGKFYAAQDIIKITHGHTTKQAVVTFKIVYIDFNY